MNRCVAIFSWIIIIDDFGWLVLIGKLFYLVAIAESNDGTFPVYFYGPNLIYLSRLIVRSKKCVSQISHTEFV